MDETATVVKSEFLRATKEAEDRLNRARYLANIGRAGQARRALEAVAEQLARARNALRGRTVARAEALTVNLRGVGPGGFVLVDLGADAFAVRRGPKGVELYEVVEA